MFLQKYMEACFSTCILGFLLDVCLLDLHVGAVFELLLIYMYIYIYIYHNIYLGNLASNSEVYVIMHLFYYVISCKYFCLLSIDVAFGKLEAVEFVNSANQENTGLNVLDLKKPTCLSDFEGT
jgi:hypothetical protein